MLTGMEGRLNLRGVGLHGRYFRVLGVQVISSLIWFIADTSKLTIVVAAGTAVEVVADGSLLEWAGFGWMGVLVRVWDGPVVMEVKDWADFDLYSPRNDPDPEMIPNPEMIPKSTPK